MERRTATRVVGYVRVSTDKQADKGVSLEAQEAKIRAYVELHDLELVDVVVDAGVSAKSLERPGLVRVLDMLKTGRAAGLLVVKLDRLTRSVRDLGELVERYFAEGRWALMSVSESIDTRSAAGRLVLNVLGSVSQWEREAIGERTSTAMQHKKARGEFIGGRCAPYGYRLRGARLVPNPKEQAVIERARSLRSKGMSLREVARRLANGGLLSRDGRRFEAMQIRRMLAA